MLIEVEPRFRLILAERRPIHFVQHARQCVQRRLQRLLVGFFLSQNIERRTDQRVRFLELDRRQFDAVFQRNVEGARRQQAEGHGLRIAVGELRVAGIGKQQLAPVFLQMLQAAMARRHLLQDLLSEQATEARAGMRKGLGAGWRLRRPAQKVRDERAQRLRRLELRAGGFDIAFEQDDFSSGFAVAPKAEPVAVGIDEIGQGLEFAPLRLVVGVGESAWVAALARRLDLDEADKCIADADRVIRPRQQMRERRLADERQAARRDCVERREFVEQPLERRPELIFGGPCDCRIVQFRPGRDAERRNDVRKCRSLQCAPRIDQGSIVQRERAAPSRRGAQASFGLRPVVRLRTDKWAGYASVTR